VKRDCDNCLRRDIVTCFLCKLEANSTGKRKPYFIRHGIAIVSHEERCGENQSVCQLGAMEVA